MIKKDVDNSIEDIKQLKTPTLTGALALSLITGGENTLRITEELKDKITSANYLSNMRNILTIPSTVGNFLVGETLPIRIIKSNGIEREAKMMINIELIALMPSERALGDSVIEILLNLDKHKTFEVLNDIDNQLNKPEIVLRDKSELIYEINKRVNITNTPIIIVEGNSVIIQYEQDGKRVAKYISNRFDIDSTIMDQDASSIFDVMFL